MAAKKKLQIKDLTGKKVSEEKAIKVKGGICIKRPRIR